MRAWIVLTLSGAAGCPGELDATERFRRDACVAQTERLFTSSCATAECHSVAASAGGLELETTSRGARLRGAVASDDPADDEDACETGLLLDPAAPEESLLYLKAAPEPPCGDRMPMNEPPLDGAEMRCLLIWIEENATTSP
jgi:hypothetical protein